MRYSTLLLAAAFVAAPISLVGCDRTASTEQTHTESTPEGSTVTKKTTSTDLDTGKTSTETTKDKTTTPNPNP